MPDSTALAKVAASEDDLYGFGIHAAHPIKTGNGSTFYTNNEQALYDRATPLADLDDSTVKRLQPGVANEVFAEMEF
jgi:hypothetical protein